MKTYTKPQQYYASATFPEGVKYAAGGHRAIDGGYQFIIEWKEEPHRACLLTAGEINALALEYPGVVSAHHISEVAKYVKGGARG